nr:hypothetical protein [uncultured Rhodopila sp.]
MPENGPGLRDLAAAFGLSSPVLLGSFDLATCSLRMSQVCLFTTDCEELSESWPDSGMWDAGAVYELQSSAPAISESECLLWRTPCEGDHHPSKITNRTSELAPTIQLAHQVDNWPTPVKEQVRASTRAPGTGGKILAEEAANWPTARAEDGASCGNHPGVVDSLTGAAKCWLAQWATPHGMSNVDANGKVGGCGGGEFGKQANQWTTPQAHDKHGPKSAESIAKGRENSKVGVRNLNEDVSQWQTPAADSFRSRGGDRKDEMGLDQQARFFPTNWITPNARDWKSETGSENNTHNKTPNLSRQVYRLDSPSLPAPTIPDGQPSSESAPTLPRRLNPRFVEWLMGFPIGWSKP